MATLMHWDEAQKASFLQLQFRTQDDQYRSAYPNARFEVVLERREPIGRLYVAPVADELRLVELTLLPEHRNRGIGTTLVQDLLDEAVRSRAFVSLHVEQANPAARLYARMGFVDVGEEGPYRRMRWAPAEIGSGTVEGTPV